MHESSVGDSFDPSDDQPDSGSDYDEFLETNSHHDYGVPLHPSTTHDMVLSNPRDPHYPCTVTFGNAHDLHETHQGVFTQLFEKCFNLTLGSEVLHFSPGYDDGHGGHGPIVADPLLTPSPFSPSSEPQISLRAHPDDVQLLVSTDRTDHHYFETRIAFLCSHWDVFHACKSIEDVKLCLEDMDGQFFYLLVVLHAAYFPNHIALDLTLGQTKRNFYPLPLRGHFQDGTFATNPSRIPLATVTVELFLVRPVP